LLLIILMDTLGRVSITVLRFYCYLYLLSSLSWYRGRRDSFLATTKEFLDFFVVLLAEHSSSFLALEEQVVSRGDVVEAVALYLLLRLDGIDAVVVDKHSHDFCIDRDLFLAQVNRRRVGWLMLATSVPWVSPDFIN